MVPTGKRPASDVRLEVAAAGLPIALTVAGSDSGGGAGIQADLKTFHQFGVYGTSVITATTAQNTRGVFDVHVVPAQHVVRQIESLATDLPPQALKSGMLATAEIAQALADALEQYAWPLYVLDPVMVATSGDRLLDSAAEDVIRTRLLPQSALVTPNLLEAAALTGRPIDSVSDLKDAGAALVEMGAGAALMKGGHLESEASDMLTDVLVVGDQVIEICHPRINSTDTHGTGCTLAAAVTACLAKDDDLETAVRSAIDFVGRAIESAPGLGAGHGPLNHFVPIAI